MEISNFKRESVILATIKSKHSFPNRKKQMDDMNIVNLEMKIKVLLSFVSRKAFFYRVYA